MTGRTVITMTDTHISVLQAAGDMMTFAAVKEIRDLAPEAAGRELTELVRRKGFAPGMDVWVVLLRKNVIMRQMVLPSHDPEELRRMVELQCARQVPYAREDIAMDFLPIDSTEDGYTRVVLVAVLREQYQRMISVCSSAGLALKHMTLGSWGLAQWCARFSAAAAEAAVCVVDLSDFECEICLCGRGSVFSSRQVDWGHARLEQEVQGFVRQLNLTLSSYARQKIGPLPTAMVVVSGKPKAESFCQTLGREFSLPVYWEDPGQGISWRRRENGSEKTVPVSALGVALARGKGFDLIPEDIKRDAHQRVRRWMTWRIAVAGGLAVVLLALVFSIDRIKGGLYAETLERQTAALKIKAGKVEEKAGRLNMLAELINDRVFLSDVIVAVDQAFPPGMSLVSLSLSRGYSLVLQGTAVRNEDINIFQKALLSSGWFSKVGLEFVNKRVETRGEVNFFKLVLKIRAREP